MISEKWRDNYIYIEKINAEPKLQKIACLRRETACLPRVWTLEITFFTKLFVCWTVAYVEYSQYLSNSATPIMDLENFTTLNLLLPVAYTRDKMQSNMEATMRKMLRYGGDQVFTVERRMPAGTLALQRLSQCGKWGLMCKKCVEKWIIPWGWSKVTLI